MVIGNRLRFLHVCKGGVYPGMTYWSQVRGSRIEYKYVYSIYGMLILRDQPEVRTLGFISLEAASGHHIARPKEVRGCKGHKPSYPMRPSIVA